MRVVFPTPWLLITFVEPSSLNHVIFGVGGPVAEHDMVKVSPSATLTTSGAYVVKDGVALNEKSMIIIRD